MKRDLASLILLGCFFVLPVVVLLLPAFLVWWVCE